jgi:hypothetical protein
MRRISISVLVLAIYAGSYAAFRQTNQEVWPKDNRTYVIFPVGVIGHALYYLWRPLSYADSALTGMRFHVGPHVHAGADGAWPKAEHSDPRQV